MPDDVIAVDEKVEEEVIAEEPIVEEPIVEEPAADAKFKDSEARDKAYGELETKLGEQGSELGTLRAENKFYKNQINQSQKQPAPEPEKLPDYDSEIAAIEEQVDNGDIPVGEGMRKTAEVTARKVEAAATQKFEQQQNQAVMESSRNAFIDQNPDFTEVQQSGALEDIKNSLPGFHDDVSAFYAYQANKTAVLHETAITEAETKSFEAGKAEMAKIASGADNTQKVLQVPGSDSTKKIGRKEGPYTQNEMRDSGMEALKASRTG